MKYISKRVFGFFNWDVFTLIWLISDVLTSIVPVNCYEDIRNLLNTFEPKENLHFIDTKIDYSINDLLKDLSEKLNDKCISKEMKFWYSMNTYSNIYGSCLQAIIDLFEVQESPFANILWKIKAGKRDKVMFISLVHK